MPVLREAIAAHQQRFYGSSTTRHREVLVTAGATEALAGTLLGLLDTGDEVVTFEPMYDSYRRASRSAGATCQARSRCARPTLRARSRRAARRDHADAPS